MNADRKDDGSFLLHGEATPMMQLLLRRRSCRRHAPGAVEPSKVAHILGAVLSFLRTTGFRSPRIVILEDGPAFRAVLDAATAGLIGKINPWLAFTEARHVILCGAVYPGAEVRPEIERAIRQASMAMEIALLAATEIGLGTCWMAGINHDRIETACPMPDGARLIAISPLGRPAPGMGVSWDAAAYHLVSKHRKPLASLWMEERWRDGT